MDILLALLAVVLVCLLYCAWKIVRSCRRGEAQSFDSLTTDVPQILRRRGKAEAK